MQWLGRVEIVLPHDQSHVHAEFCADQQKAVAFGNAVECLAARDDGGIDRELNSNIKQMTRADFMMIVD